MRRAALITCRMACQVTCERIHAKASEVRPWPRADRSPHVSGDRTPPTTPTSLRVTATGARSVSLAWNPSTDKSRIATYRIYRSGGYEFRVPGTQTTFTWTTLLESSQTYSFFVYAVDSAGNNSKHSNTVTVTLPPDTQPPTAPVLAADPAPSSVDEG